MGLTTGADGLIKILGASLQNLDPLAHPAILDGKSGSLGKSLDGFQVFLI